MPPNTITVKGTERKCLQLDSARNASTFRPVKGELKSLNFELSSISSEEREELLEEILSTIASR